ncbi:MULTISPECIES: hypothetical protein [Colwellia]|uniref:Cytochrome c domain-containing protein n=1 Tax=Colwellia marinimaniae TaxID=1513592 RepID=A0ABQ0MXZ9_9GAMM|nr:MULTISPECIES: hypothetical protein [Colwellia]GAW97198.1 hypothetical protein MTCD1_02824 [Colwellia marinimaniae]
MKLLFITMIGLLTACNAGNGENLDGQGQPLEPVIAEDITDDDGNEEKSTLLWIQDNVFSPICVECHGGANPAAGQNLSDLATSAKNLINVTSANANFKRVLPGSAQNSYLYLKITGASQAGARMPLGKPALSTDAINAIKQWITLGALVPPNSNISAQVNYSHMATRQLNEHKSATLTLSFNQPMNFSSLASEQILINASSPTATWSISDENITLSVINPQTLKITISQLPLAVTQLKFSLNNNSISSIISIGGQLLDGNYNNVDGGEFNYEHNF